MLIYSLCLFNIACSLALLYLNHLEHKPVRRAHNARHIVDEGIVLAERTNLKGVAKMLVAVDYCEQEGKRSRVKLSRNQWAKLVEIRLGQSKKLLQ